MIGKRFRRKKPIYKSINLDNFTTGIRVFDKLPSLDSYTGKTAACRNWTETRNKYGWTYKYIYTR